MPIYEYHCRECDATFEALVRSGDDVTCPNCASSSLRKLVTAAVTLSGRTARLAGHTCCGREERCDAPPCADGSACRRG